MIDAKRVFDKGTSEYEIRSWFDARAHEVVAMLGAKRNDCVSIDLTIIGHGRADDLGNCFICGEPRFDTPSGATCKNGHGGA